MREIESETKEITEYQKITPEGRCGFLFVFSQYAFVTQESEKESDLNGVNVIQKKKKVR